MTNLGLYPRRPFYKCHYCRANCTRDPFQHDAGQTEPEVWKCQPCKALYRFRNLSENCVCVELWAQIKEDLFFISLYEDHTVVNKMVMIMEDIGDYEENWMSDSIKRIDLKLEGINPQNVTSKIKTILTFS